MNFITDFADQAVALPVAAAVLAVLLAGRWFRGAFAWGGAVLGVLGVMLGLKLAMFACGAQLGAFATQSPSGHTAAAAMVYGGLASLAVRQPRAGAWAALAMAASVAALIGLTRIALGVHSLRDVAVGAAVGVAGAALMRRLAGERPAAMPGLRLAGVVVLAMIVFHGQRLQAEARIRHLAIDVWPLTLCKR